MRRIGLALGGGGVRGLVHIGVLERLDALGIKPAAIAGCSMGAILGALYAAGHSGRWIRGLLERRTPLDEDGWRETLKKGASLLRWVASMTPELQRGGLVNVDKLLHDFLRPVAGANFEDLEIPLWVVATDFWTAEQVVFSRGPLLPAVRASMAVPGVFAPVQIEGRTLVDGGLVNQLPYDLLPDNVDLRIAVDAAAQRVPGKKGSPSTLSGILGASDIMQRALLGEKLKRTRPEILIQPTIRNVEMLDLAKMDEMLRLGRSAGDAVQTRLGKLQALPDPPAEPR